MSRGEREIDDTLPAGDRAAEGNAVQPWHERRHEETLPADEQGAERRPAAQPTLSSACARPRRYGLASRVEKAQAAAALFGEPAEQVKLGRFELREYVGGGGMGEVYAAYDPKLKRKVALKMVRGDRVTTPQADDRLLREAQVLAQVDHPNVVHVYEVDQLEDRVFLAMELVHGRSLRLWLQALDEQKGRARLREVLRQFMAAGSGLQAAHAKGLVHRDFKPDNVLVGDDGRVRVVDFGLARPVTDLALAAPPDRPEPAGAIWLDDDTLTPDRPDGGRQPRWRRSDRVMTTYGRIVGTPRYMSPEQMRGEEADHRSDQFSFCVALYEALYLQTPFSGGSIPALLESVKRGRIAEPPRGAGVPAGVRKAIWRGLAADPEARFPDMGALLDVLEPWQHPHQWSRIVAAGMVGAALVGGSLIFVPPSEPCSDTGAAVAGLWAPERRSAIRAAFLATDLSYAAATWSTLEPDLDRYARRLESEMVTTCKATHGQEDSDLAVLRMLCLTGPQRRLEAFIDQLEHADASVVERAHEVAAALPDLATCDIETLRHGMKPPPPGVATQVDEIRKHLAEARTAELFRKSDDALRIARTQLERAQAVPYGPVQAEALYQVGRVLVFRGAPEERDEGESMLLRAVNLAESERHDDLVPEIWNFLVLGADRNHSSTERARQWHERADAAIRRIDDLPSFRADALRNLARIYLKEGKFAEAEAAQRAALAMLERAPDASRLELAAYQYDLAIIVQQLGRYQEAQELYERTLPLYIAELGETHPRVADMRYDIAMLHQARGASAAARQLLEDVVLVHGETPGDAQLVAGNAHRELAELDRQSGALASAHAHLMKSLDIYQRIFGAGHARLAAAYVSLGAIEFRRGLPEQALAAYETSLAINTQHLDPTHIDVGFDQMNIAEAKVALGQYHEALVALERAEQILRPHLADMPALPAFLASVRGQALLGKGELAGAVVALERANHGFEALPPDLHRVERADAGWALVQALSQSGRADDPRALGLARAALAVYEGQGPEVHTPLREVQRWLAEHERR